MAPWLDILWRIGTWGVVALGAIVVFLALFADADRGWRARRRTGTPRLRCPGGWGRILWLIPVRAGCWYDMGGLISEFQPGKEPDARVRCPECGRRHKPRRLRAARRRWGIAALGLGVALLGLGGRYSREVYQRGWSAVPGEVLVLVPFDERTWLETGKTGSHWLIEEAAQEIAARDAEGRLSDWAAAHLGQRVQRRYMRDPDYGVDDASRAVFARLESTPFTQGIDARPFAEAVRTIAAVAGVEIEVDEAALAAAHIEFQRPVTVPPFSLMTCEQALDWACDRARARQGWAKGEWDVRDGRVVVTDDGSVYATARVLVLTNLPAGSDAYVMAEVAAFNVSPDRWATYGGVFADAYGVRRALVVSSSSIDLLRVDRLVRRVSERSAAATVPSQGMAEFDERLRHARVTPISREDSLAVLIHRLRTEAGISVVVDPWGIDLHTTLGERLDRGRLGIVWDERAQAARSAAELLWWFDADYVQDGHTVLVGRRCQSLVRQVAWYTIAPPPPYANSPGASGTENLWPQYLSRRRALELRLNEAAPHAWRHFGGLAASLHDVGGYLVVVAPPDMQARAERVIEQFMAEHPDWTVPPAGAAPE